MKQEIEFKKTEIGKIRDQLSRVKKDSKNAEEKEAVKRCESVLHKLTKKPSYREEANAMVHQCLRAGFIEDLHAGESSKLLDNSKYSRITQEEMKKLMIETSAVIAEFLEMKDKNSEKYIGEINRINLFFTSNWDKRLNKYQMKNETKNKI